MDGQGLGKKERVVEAAPDWKEPVQGSSGEDHSPCLPAHSVGASGSLTRQSSMSKGACLCAPTTHAGSFRCRLHRTPSLQRTKSIEASRMVPADSSSKTDPDAADPDTGASVIKFTDCD
ncbi:hypothetical protein MLD38_025497 [Melastoma candidum]|uniref:Uncharacterized protein n=1 Tax=Melastoma candidum TaxID=119954 RepID=A0ACB9NWJ3_9MYRT|nr:hypothetical protein MLD38_025497 [Melastoma candidum]